MLSTYRLKSKNLPPFGIHHVVHLFGD